MNQSSICTHWRNFPHGTKYNAWAIGRFCMVYHLAESQPPAAAPPDQIFRSIGRGLGKKKAGPLALDPVAAEVPPMKKNNKLVQLLQLSAPAIVSHPFGSQLESWTTRVAVNCGAEWTREAVNLTVAQVSHPAAIAPDIVNLAGQQQYGLLISQGRFHQGSVLR